MTGSVDAVSGLTAINAVLGMLTDRTLSCVSALYWRTASSCTGLVPSGSMVQALIVILAVLAHHSVVHCMCHQHLSGICAWSPSVAFGLRSRLVLNLLARSCGCAHDQTLQRHCKEHQGCQNICRQVNGMSMTPNYRQSILAAGIGHWHLLVCLPRVSLSTCAFAGCMDIVKFFPTLEGGMLSFLEISIGDFESKS